MNVLLTFVDVSARGVIRFVETKAFVAETVERAFGVEAVTVAAAAGGNGAFVYV